MLKKELFAIGHITNDLEPKPHLGGAVSYAAVAVARLGMKAHVITEAPPDHPYLQELEALGVLVHRLPTIVPPLESHLTAFRNFYDEAGHRRQIESNRQDDINLADLPNFPSIPSKSVVLVAPVIAEVNVELFTALSRAGHLVVAPQGYFRSVDEEGLVKRLPWKDVDALSRVEMVILSDEDITFREKMDEDYLDRIKGVCPVVVLTRGDKGLTIYHQGRKPLEIKAFKLEKEEIISPTGAGDSCAAAFIWHYFRFGDFRQAGIFATFYPALKLMGIGSKERGLRALPTLDQVRSYISQNPERFKRFLESNEVNSLSLEAESSTKPAEKL
ncbi:MAG: PfkB family carbohydrate kinase [Patescibacteria group bacterium]|nr:PfkB family carbohydrate kinase [Patescibacteria group bacterium]